MLILKKSMKNNLFDLTFEFAVCTSDQRSMMPVCELFSSDNTNLI